MTFENRFSNDKIAEFSGNPSSPKTSILLKGNLRRVRPPFTYATRPRKLAVRATPGGHMGSKYLPLHSIFVCFGKPIRQGLSKISVVVARKRFFLLHYFGI